MMMKLFHGTTEKNLTPQYGKGNSNSDFGRGFYCTADFDKAICWACKKGTPGYVHEYILDEKGLNILDLTSETYNAMEYLALLLKNRYLSVKNKAVQDSINQIITIFAPNLDGVDLVISRRADDSYFMFAKDFLTGVIPYSYLKDAMNLGSLGVQKVLLSKTAFERLHYIKTYTENSDKPYRQYMAEDAIARDKYRKLRDAHWDRNTEVVVSQILDEGWDKNDPRLY